jgi:hypothetical protein
MKERHQEGTSIPFYHFPLVVFASQYPLTLTRNIRYYLIEKIIYKSTLKMKELSKKIDYVLFLGQVFLLNSY